MKYDLLILRAKLLRLDGEGWVKSRCIKGMGMGRELGSAYRLTSSSPTLNVENSYRPSFLRSLNDSPYPIVLWPSPVKVSRLGFEPLLSDESPNSRIICVVAVIAHYEVHVLWNFNWSVVA